MKRVLNIRNSVIVPEHLQNYFNTPESSQQTLPAKRKYVSTGNMLRDTDILNLEKRDLLNSELKPWITDKTSSTSSGSHERNINATRRFSQKRTAEENLNYLMKRLKYVQSDLSIHNRATDNIAIENINSLTKNNSRQLQKSMDSIQFDYPINEDIESKIFDMNNKRIKVLKQNINVSLSPRALTSLSPIDVKDKKYIPMPDFLYLNKMKYIREEQNKMLRNIKDNCCISNPVEKHKLEIEKLCSNYGKYNFNNRNLISSQAKQIKTKNLIQNVHSFNSFVKPKYVELGVIPGPFPLTTTKISQESNNFGCISHHIPLEDKFFGTKPTYDKLDHSSISDYVMLRSDPSYDLNYISNNLLSFTSQISNINFLFL